MRQKITEGTKNMELYKTVRSQAEATNIIEKSRFIAHVKPVSSKEEADAFVAEIKTKNRYHSKLINFDILKKYCSFIRKIYKAGDLFYRARISERSGNLSVFRKEEH